VTETLRFPVSDREFPLAFAPNRQTCRLQVIPDARRYRRVKAGTVTGKVLMLRRGPSGFEVETNKGSLGPE